MEILAVGELVNQFINDPVRFWGAPLLYGGQPPTFLSGHYQDFDANKE